MSFGTVVLLLVAALIAGALNSVAGGGSFFTFPALLFAGVAPIPANATNTLAVWPGSVASIIPYRDTFATQRRTLVTLSLISLVGGTAGSIVLLRTPSGTFKLLIPALLLFATLLFAYGGAIARWLRQRLARDDSTETPLALRIALPVIQMVIAFYGGFFGAGIGMLMLALFSLMEMKDVHTMNALKVVMASFINGVAVVIFIIAGIVVWQYALLMAGASIVGGYGGAAIARRMNPQTVRTFVIVVGLAMSAYFGLTTYLLHR